MNFLKRALLAVSRRRGKSAILFIVFLLIANMVLTGLAIQHATDYASVLARQKLGGTLTLQYNMQAAMQSARNSGQQRPQIQSEPITEDMVKTILQQKNIVDYNYLVSTNGLAENFDPVVTESDSTTTSNQSTSGSNNSNSGQNSNVPNGGGNLMNGQSGFTMPDVSIEGVSYTSLLDTFKQGTSTITEGKELTADDEGTNSALIEKNLADQNSLKVGDTITVKGTRSDDTVNFKIVGIYQTTDTASQGSGMRNLSFSSPYNKIYVDYKSALPLKANSSTSTSETSSSSESTVTGADSVAFYLDDPQNIEKAETEIKAMNIDWSKFSLDANDAAYKEMVGPIENVASFSMTVVYIVAIAGAVILALILTLSIRERNYETGVLLSMGEGKRKVVGQYLAEVLLIAVVAFGLSTISGHFIAQKVGDTLLSREITVVQNQQSSSSGQGYSMGGQGASGSNQQRFGSNGQFNRQYTGSQKYQPVDTLTIQITPQEIGKMAGIGLLVVIAGTIVPASTVMRFKPKKILTKTM